MSEIEHEIKTIRILATSDTHGRFYPWDYHINEKADDGSIAHLSTILKERMDPDTTILVDAGDTIQDNSAELFLEEPVHPMIDGLNGLGYDILVTGNHDYNYGMDVLMKMIHSFQGTVLTGNVYDAEGNHIAPGCKIIQKNGIRVALIGMVTPNIMIWDAANLAGCKVTSAIDETKQILSEIEAQYDILIAVLHMGISNELNAPETGVTDFAAALPQFDLIVASHEHNAVEEMYLNQVLTVENLDSCRTMVQVDFTMEKTADGYRIRDKKSSLIRAKDYEPDPVYLQKYKAFHERAVQNAVQVIGRLEGEALLPDTGMSGVPIGMYQKTAMIQLINDVMRYYSGAEVSATSLYSMNQNLQPGPIRSCDTAVIYRYGNALYKVRMSGRQLKQFMQWSTSLFVTWKKGNLTVSFNPNISKYTYVMFDGLNYEVNVSKEAGNRIEHLTWPDGRPVEEDDVIDLALNDYLVNSYVCNPGVIFDASEMPEILERDIHSEIGGIREMVKDYIIRVKNGVITVPLNVNWKLTGMEWDVSKHQEVMRRLKEGILTFVGFPYDKQGCPEIREEDL